jgi:hypothetical protein
MPLAMHGPLDARSKNTTSRDEVNQETLRGPQLPFSVLLLIAVPGCVILVRLPNYGMINARASWQ